MTPTVRELISGATAAAGLLVLMFLCMMPWWLASLLAAGLYVGLRVGLPLVPRPPESVHEGGVTID